MQVRRQRSFVGFRSQRKWLLQAYEFGFQVAVDPTEPARLAITLPFKRGNGAERRHLTAKVFGGGSVLGIRKDGLIKVARENIDFTFGYLAEEGIPVVASDVGGRDPDGLRRSGDAETGQPDRTLRLHSEAVRGA